MLMSSATSTVGAGGAAAPAAVGVPSFDCVSGEDMDRLLLRVVAVDPADRGQQRRDLVLQSLEGGGGVADAGGGLGRLVGRRGEVVDAVEPVHAGGALDLVDGADE